jgi:hypothetical protein
MNAITLGAQILPVRLASFRGCCAVLAQKRFVIAFLTTSASNRWVPLFLPGTIVACGSTKLSIRPLYRLSGRAQLIPRIVPVRSDCSANSSRRRSYLQLRKTTLNLRATGSDYQGWKSEVLRTACMITVAVT